MLKKNKCKVILSVMIILLPMVFGILLWKELPDSMTTHWGADGNADGFSTKAFAVFGVPCVILALHVICLLLTLLDKKQKAQNQKALGMIFWIFPIISLWANGIVYCAALGREIDLTVLIPVLLGIMFIFMGNYLPKIKQNSTLGIKVRWTLHNEENWNKTHRLGGKVWVVGGLVLLFAAFLPAEAMVGALLLVTVALMAIPLAYSYCIYKQHQKNGIAYAAPQRSKAEKTAARIASVIIAAILIGVVVLMFTGDIEVKCSDTSFAILADYYADIEVDYAQLDTVQYRKDLDVGLRTNGFGSPRLSMGIFENGEFGPYTLYAYTGAKEFVVLTSGDRTLVIGLKSPEDTQALYEDLSVR